MNWRSDLLLGRSYLTWLIDTDVCDTKVIVGASSNLQFVSEKLMSTSKEYLAFNQILIPRGG